MERVILFLLLAILTEIAIQDRFRLNNQNTEHDDGQNRAKTLRFKTFTPTILMVIVVEVPTPFFKEQLKKLRALDYPKKKIHVLIYSHVPYHTAHINSFVNKTIREYVSVRKLSTSVRFPWQKVADISKDYCRMKKCDYSFRVQSTVQLDNPLTLQVLLEENKVFVAPLLSSPEKARNGLLRVRASDSLTKDSMEIIQKEDDCILVNTKLVDKYKSGIIDDLEMNGGKVYYMNVTYFGHLVNTFNFNVSKPSPEMYEILDNPVDWEAKYINPLYLRNFLPDNVPLKPRPFVLWFPLVKRVFCKHLIHMIHRYNFCRIEDSYQKFDVYLEDLYWGVHYRYFLKKYVLPLGNLYVKDFSLMKPMSGLHYVVKYNTSEQYSSVGLHMDNSKYSVTIELNQYGVDYDGGGCRYEEYNCTVFSRPGWTLIHPGHLKHEGLQVTRGVRYVLVCFLNPEITVMSVHVTHKL